MEIKPTGIILWLLVTILLGGCSFAFVKPLDDKEIIAVDESKFEYAKAGHGSPVIVFLSGYGAEMDTAWGKVWPQVKGISTVFAYNRLGYGASDRAEHPQSGSVIVAALRDLLHRQGLRPPYVLVGHSIGGLYANLFARQHPREVAGVVLVDSSHPDQQEITRDKAGVMQRVTSGVLFALDAVVHSRHSEITSFEQTAQEIKHAGPFPDIPLVVVTAGVAPPSWFIREDIVRMHEDNQRDLVRLSPHGKQVIAHKSGHFVQNAEPEVVVAAIRDVVEKVRGR